jgi:pyruvate formate lyase activating enzyme
VPAGYVAGIHVDPIEKKPFYHALPGSRALSFGMLGCSYHCEFCQNWITSQTLRDPVAGSDIEEAGAEEIVGLAVRHGAPIISSTYNEPLITSEWSAEILRLAKEKGILGAYVSNGYATPQVLDYLRPWVQLFKVDLKCFDDHGYRKLGGVLASVLRTIALLKEKGFWVEVVTLIVPGFNDSDAQLRGAAAFLSSISADIPWHLTAFHPEYRMRDREATPAKTLLTAARIGEEAGLRYVYTGNVAGLGESENTRCPSCRATVIRRRGMRVIEMRVRDGACPDCRAPIAGVWSADGVADIPEED